MFEGIKGINGEILIFIACIIVLAIVSAALKKGKLIFTIPIKCIIGGLVIYIINMLAGQFTTFSIPLNPLTASLVGLLHLPGLVLILMIKYIIYPL